MGRYLLRRLLGVLAVVVGLVLFTFFATRLIGDPVSLMVDPELASEADRQAIRQALGLDDPLPVQFGRYVLNIARGDFGVSLWQHRPATAVVFERIPATMLLAGVTVVFSLVVAVTLALLAAWRRGTMVEHVIFVVSTALACIPSFWLALALILLFAVTLTIFPTSGYGQPINLVLPVLALSAQPIGYFTQVLRSGLQRELNEPYTRTARAKGLRERSVLLDHILRNASILTATMISAMLASLVNGTVLAESVFAWPGIGHLGLQAVHNRDLPVLTAVIFYAGVSVALVNVALDLVYLRLDPRIRLS